MSLTAEIIKQIFITIDYKNLFDKKYQSNKKISIEYEDDQIGTYSIWSSKHKIQNNSLYIICTKMDEEIHLILQLDKNPMFGFSYNERPSMKILQNNVWISPSIYLQANLLSGVELLSSWGILFESSPPSEEMVEALAALIDVT